eukprot:scaffold1469_cov257-Pinguiococcus_pyrenoidosus.AAC.6
MTYLVKVCSSSKSRPAKRDCNDTKSDSNRPPRHRDTAGSSICRDVRAIFSAEDPVLPGPIVRIVRHPTRAEPRLLGADSVRPRAVVQAILVLAELAVVSRIADAPRHGELDRAPSIVRAAVGAVLDGAVVAKEGRGTLALAEAVADAVRDARILRGALPLLTLEVVVEDGSVGVVVIASVAAVAASLLPSEGVVGAEVARTRHVRAVASVVAGIAGAEPQTIVDAELPHVSQREGVESLRRGPIHRDVRSQPAEDDHHVKILAENGAVAASMMWRDPLQLVGQVASIVDAIPATVPARRLAPRLRNEDVLGCPAILAVDDPTAGRLALHTRAPLVHGRPMRPVQRDDEGSHGLPRTRGGKRRQRLPLQVAKFLDLRCIVDNPAEGVRRVLEKVGIRIVMLLLLPRQNVKGRGVTPLQRHREREVQAFVVGEDPLHVVRAVGRPPRVDEVPLLQPAPKVDVEVPRVIEVEVVAVAAEEEEDVSKHQQHMIGPRFRRGAGAGVRRPEAAGEVVAPQVAQVVGMGGIRTPSDARGSRGHPRAIPPAVRGDVREGRGIPAVQPHYVPLFVICRRMCRPGRRPCRAALDIFPRLPDCRPVRAARLSRQQLLPSGVARGVRRRELVRLQRPLGEHPQVVQVPPHGQQLVAAEGRLGLEAVVRREAMPEAVAAEHHHSQAQRYQREAPALPRRSAALEVVQLVQLDPTVAIAQVEGPHVVAVVFAARREATIHHHGAVVEDSRTVIVSLAGDLADLLPKHHAALGVHGPRMQQLPATAHAAGRGLARTIPAPSRCVAVVGAVEVVHPHVIVESPDRRFRVPLRRRGHGLFVVGDELQLAIDQLDFVRAGDVLLLQLRRAAAEQHHSGPVQHHGVPSSSSGSMGQSPHLPPLPAERLAVLGIAGAVAQSAIRIVGHALVVPLAPGEYHADSRQEHQSQQPKSTAAAGHLPWRRPSAVPSCIPGRTLPRGTSF